MVQQIGFITWYPYLGWSYNSLFQKVIPLQIVLKLHLLQIIIKVDLKVLSSEMDPAEIRLIR